MDISKLNVTELKAAAFDVLVEIERMQKNLQLINAQIKIAQQPVPKKEAVKEVKEVAKKQN